MRIRDPRVRSEHASLQTLYEPLLHLAQVIEKDEDEVDTRDAKTSIDFSHAAWDQYDSRTRNSTAPSTESEELPEMETRKEVAVPSVNPSLQGQDGEEHVTSMANSLQVNGDVGIEKHGKESELTGLAILSVIVIGTGARKLHPVLIEQRESDSELPSWLDPSKAPEGSLLHSLYLQLLDAGSLGITVRELSKYFKELAQVQSFGLDWKVQFWWHLKTNPYFCVVQKYHYLVCNPQLEVQQPKRSPANIASTSRRYGASSSKTVLSSHHPTPVAVQTDLSVDTHEGGDRTRRKAFQNAEKAIAIAAMSEQATEFEKMHQSMGDMQMLSSVADPTDSQLVSHGPPSPSSRKRKSPSSHIEELAHHGHPIPGGWHATQAESHTNVDLSSLLLHPESATFSPPTSPEDSPSHTQAAKNVHKPSAGVSNHDDDSDGEQLQQLATQECAQEI